MDFQPPYLPPPPPDFLAPSPGPIFPPGLKPRPFQYSQMCPSMPVHILHEHQDLLESVSNQQGQIHRLHLELGAAHDQLTKEGDLLVQLDARLGDLEVRCSVDQRRTEEALSSVSQDLQKGGVLLAQVLFGLSDLEQRQQPPPPQHQEMCEPQMNDWQEQEGSSPSSQIVADQGTQTGPHPSAPAATLPVHTTPDSFRPDSQCMCSPSPSHRPVQCQGQTPPPGGAGFSFRTFPSTVGFPYSLDG